MRGRDTSKDTSNVSYKLPRSMVGKKEMSHIIVDEDNALMDPRIMVL